MHEHNGVCPFCEDIRPIKTLRRNETQEIRGQSITAEAVYNRCSECGGEFETADQMEQNLETFRSLYRKNNDIITPQEIVALRKKYNISQKAFGRVLDIGDLTINSYEQGALPSGAHNSLMKLCKIEEIFKILFKRNISRLTTLQKRKVEEVLLKYKYPEQAEPLPFSGDPESKYPTAAEPVAQYSTGNTQYQSNIFDMIQLILAFAGKPLYKMVLLKILFYCDFSYAATYGKPISGWRYAKLPYGPVPNDYKQILCDGEKAGKFIVTPQEERGEKISLPENSNEKDTFEHFSRNETDLIKTVVNKLKHRTATQLSNMTHDEEAWKNTVEGKIISYTWSKTLRHGIKIKKS